MFRLSPKMAMAMVMVMIFGLNLAIQVQAAPDGDWNAVKARIESARDYTLKYDYSSERGVLKFDYSVSLAGPRIRTEVLRGSSRNVGSIVVYDPSFAADKVRAKVGMGRITRGLDHPDVVGTPFFQPLFTMILNELKSYPTMKVAGTENVRGQQTTVYEFSGTSATEYRVWVNANHEMVRTEKKRAGKVIETRDFRQIRWNCDPKVGF